MWVVLSAITRAFNVVLAPFSPFSPWVGLILISVVTGVVMLLIFGKTSNQKRITETKEKLKAYIMEMWIFRNDTRVMFRAIGGVFRNNVHYLRHSLKPLVFIIVPVLLVMVQLGIRYAESPLGLGDTATVRVKLRRGAVPTALPVELAATAGVRVVTPPLRIDADREIDWVVEGRLPGDYLLSLAVGDEALTKTVSVGRRASVEPLAGVRARAGTWDAFLYPSEKPIPRGSIVESISVGYPSRRLTVFGFGVNWLVAFFVISLVSGYAMKGVFGIDV
jgi:hypothetical protein